jgi:hypothetical protein
MLEKLGQSGFNGFDIKMIVKIHAIDFFFTSLRPVLDLPANYHRQSNPISLKKGHIGCAD